MKIFIDTAPFIYHFENHPIYAEKFSSFFSEKYLTNTVFLTSVITIMEFGVMPYRKSRDDINLEFESFLNTFAIEIAPIDKEIAKKAAQIRANFPSFKAMDSLQFATAQNANCNIFLTNDKQLIQFSGISVLLLDEL